MDFEIVSRDHQTSARAGKITTAHGEIETPVFMPVGTAATVKCVHRRELEDDIDARIILGNTYHLYLRPGLEILEKAGGLHGFSGWNRALLTDSGGFQVFSLSSIRKLKEEGVHFRSHIDGSKHLFTPENVVDTQRIIGADIIMALDECTPGDADYNYARKSMELTVRWMKRGWEHFRNTTPRYGYEQAFFPIVQGCVYPELRRQSAEEAAALGAPGNAIGGLSVGEEKSKFNEFLAYTASYITMEKPRYVMGIGSPDYIFEAVENGIDLFDCVLATRMARNGSVFTDDGPLVLKKAIHKFDHRPLEEGCTCTACRKYSRAYLHHLVKCNEMFGGMLLTEHNLTYLYNLMQRIRASIEGGTFLSFKKEYLERYYGK